MASSVSPQLAFFLDARSASRRWAFLWRWLCAVESCWVWLSRRRWTGLATVALLAMAVCTVLALHAPLHYPRTHDEFGYLLAADTFAHGRLTNPTHPLWIHFESMHLLSQPSYMAKYPPAQGLFLALGWVLFGHPIAGVYLSFMLACTAICWMLQAWLPSRWALLGGVLAVLMLAPTIWANSYWGGAVACLGGALVFGGFRRLLDAPRLLPTLALGLGLAILANSRPYEGLAACLPAAVVFLVRMIRERKWRSIRCWAAVVAPLVLCLGLTASWMAWYNYCVTGNPWRTPYQVHDAAYSAAPLFLWQAPLEKTPEYHHQALRDYYVGHEVQRYNEKRFLWGFNISLFTKLYTFARFFVGPVFLLPVLVLARYNRNRWVWFAALVCGVELLALTQTLYLFPHYAAPVACLMIFLLVQGLRQVCLWKGLGGRGGRLIALGTVVALLIPLGYCCATTEEPSPRQGVQTALEKIEGRHLVVVRYGPEHDCHREWVYNEADIDGARVVWARDLGASGNRALLDYYRDRKVWLLSTNGPDYSLVPYE